MSGDDSADSDDDWFESALAEDGTESDDTPDASGDGTAGEADDWGGDSPDSANGATEPDGADGATEPDGPAQSDADGAFTGGSDRDTTSPFGDMGTDPDEAFGDAETDSPFGDTGTGGGDSLDGGSSAFDDGDDSLFEDSFGEVMGAAGGGSEEFDDDLDTDIPRLDIGIEGLDNMIQGGVPERHLIVIIGGAGTGKTTFGLQFLHHGLTKDDTDRGVFITLEQTYEDILSTADERGWEFERHVEEGNLAIVDLDPVEMANSLDNIRGELPELIEEFDADRFVLDSVSLLEMMYDKQSRRRTEVFDFTQSLKDAGVTTVFTSEAAENNPYASRHGVIEYLTDVVFLLRYVRSETRETRLAVEIQKIRNANHSRETKPYEITLDGISVYEQANIF